MMRAFSDYHTLVWIAVILLLTGCARSYRYLSGQKAEVHARGWALAFPTLYQMGILPETKVLDKEDLGQLERLANPPGAKTLRELMADGWDALSGEDYTIRVGERQQDILKEIGPPITKHQKPVPLAKPFDEAWEYPFCFIYFKNGRVRDLVFKRIEGPAYYEGAAVITAPPSKDASPD